MKFTLHRRLFLMIIISIFLYKNVILVHSQCLGDQQSLLLQLKSNLTFDPASSLNLVNWNQSDDCCSWDGITCSDGRVIGLSLSSESITGGLDNSSSLFSLQYLQNLSLAYNNFKSSQIPSGFDKLTNLIYLNLSNAGFGGQIPIEISHLIRLVALDLSTNSLDESIPLSLFSLPSLQKLQLSNNRFSGKLSEFNVSSSLLETLDLSNNSLEGPIPMSVFHLRGLKHLSLSSNKFNGSFPLTDSSLSSSPRLTTLKLASCNLTTFPAFLRNQSKLYFLDLSKNEIQGEIPNWIWKLQNLQYLNLSCNNLVNLEGRILDIPSMMSVLDLHSNQLQGQLPVLPPYATYLDFSRNNFSSSIPASIGDNLTVTYFFSLSSNNFGGSIPKSVCNASYLLVLDLSNNSLSGEIPQCLYAMTKTLRVLNLNRNNLSGTISDTFPVNCGLQNLDLSRNVLEGMVPKSLANCSSLEVLNLGNNKIKDKFPCHLKNMSLLRVLGLRENRFYGSIGCAGQNATWQMLQIADLALNNFSGKLPKKCIKTWGAMIADEDKTQFKYRADEFNGLYYYDAITVRIKGQDMVLLRILTVSFPTIDVSCNNLVGQIPKEIGALNALVTLNLSQNALTGQIPPSLGNLTELESLDLSSNILSGNIPMQLLDLTFLAVLNLSFNQLVGVIPRGRQFSTFDNSSFVGNKGLCGSPLSNKCIDSSMVPSSTPTESQSKSHSNHGVSIAWKYIIVEVGFVFGFGIVIFPLMLWKRWRIWYYNHVDDILFRILFFAELYLGKEYRGRGRRVFINWW